MFSFNLKPLFSLSLFIGALSVLNLAHADLIQAKSAITQNVIQGHYPYLNSIGTKMYHVGNEGNRGIIDDNGYRLPTVGSIIGLDDTFCAVATQNETTSANNNFRYVIGRIDNESEPNFVTPLYDYRDSDFDPCRIFRETGEHAVHEIHWYILDTNGKPFSEMQKFEDFTATEITNERFPNSIIPAGSIVSVEDQNKLISQEPISGQYTAALRVPEAALGHYIGVIYTPASQYGLPYFGKPIKMWDLRYLYKQTPPSKAGFLPFEVNDGEKYALNDVDGTGGGIVRPAVRRPLIQDLKISGTLAGGHTLNLEYRFVPNVTTPHTDESIFVWGPNGVTAALAEMYDETLSFEDNLKRIELDIVTASKGKTFEVNPHNIGHVIEVAALPIRQDNGQRYPIVGSPVTYQLSDFSPNLVPLKAPKIESLSIIGPPVLNGVLSASYKYTPSNSVKNDDGSYYRWSVVSLLDEETLFSSGTVDRTALPNIDYTQPVLLPSTPLLTAQNMTGKLIRLTLEARDLNEVPGNTLVDETPLTLGKVDTPVGIKLVYGNYEGVYPATNTAGAFPVLGFKGATFQIFAEEFDKQKNFNNWHWVSQYPDIAKVDNYGVVTLLKDTALGKKIQITAINKFDQTRVVSHTFRLTTWLYSRLELLPAYKLVNYQEAVNTCTVRSSPPRITLQVPKKHLLTGAMQDPLNNTQSKNPHTDAEARQYVYQYPNASYYSHWGNLANYPAVSDNGTVLNSAAFHDGGLPFFWANGEGVNNTTLAYNVGLTGLGNWFQSLLPTALYNVACIRFMTTPEQEIPLPPLVVTPAIPEIVSNPMMAIKLPYVGYPNNARGFPTAHRVGQGFPSLGFTGAEFMLFAQDLPGSALAVANNLSNNRNWRWRVDNQPEATSVSPSRNQYVQVSYEGQVILLNRPPKDLVITIYARMANGVERRHTFKIDKWLLTSKQVSSTLTMSRPDGRNACAVRNARLPRVEEYTSVPPSPANPNQSQGAGTRPPGWQSIYSYPSTSFYSQWGQLNIYKEYNPVTGTVISLHAFPAGSYFWTSSQSPNNRAIFAAPSGWGDWAADANEGHLRHIACILD